MAGRLHEGSRFRDLSAKGLNDAMDAGAAFAAASAGGTIGAEGVVPRWNPAIVRVKNTTESACELGDPVGLGDATFDANDGDAIALAVPTCDSVAIDDTDTLGRWGIWLGPTKPNAAFPVAVAGVVWAKVTVNSADHHYADFLTGDGLLSSADSGRAEIVYSGAGNWCLIKLGVSSNPPTLYKLTSAATGTGSTCPSAAATAITFNGTTFSDVSGAPTETIYFPSAPMDAGDYVAIDAAIGTRWSAKKTGDVWIVEAAPPRALQEVTLVSDVASGTNLNQDKITFSYVGKAPGTPANTEVGPFVEYCSG